MPAGTLAAMFEALDANGWLANCDAVLTGYLPSVDHVTLAETVMDRVLARNPTCLIVCDPVLGDDPDGLFLPPEVAEAIRDRLVPKAVCLKPNRFELAYLSGCPVTDLDQAVAASRALGPRMVAASSVPVGKDGLATVAVTPNRCTTFATERKAHAPHGTGDLLTALVTAALVEGLPFEDGVAHAVAVVDRCISASEGADELVLALADLHSLPQVP